MLHFGFIIAVGLAFSRLAKKYQKIPWLFGLVGGFIASMFVGISALLVQVVSPSTFKNSTNFMAGFKILFLSIALAGFFSWLLYMLVEFLWKREAAAVTKSELLDEDLE